MQPAAPLARLADATPDRRRDRPTADSQTTVGPSLDCGNHDIGDPPL